MVNYVHFDGDPELRFSNNQIFKFNVDAVSRVCSRFSSIDFCENYDTDRFPLLAQVEDREFYFIGDVVKVIEDMTRLHDLQKEGPGWVDELALVSVLLELSHLLHCESFFLSH